MDLHQLRTFVAIAQEGHLTRAAERLHISQPTASGHIRALEESLRVVLLVRRSGGVEVTPAGKLLLQRAEALLDQALEFRSAARSLAAEASGSLTLGSSADPDLSRIGAVVAAMRESYPLLEIRIELRATAAILRGLRSGELDAGFFLGHQPEEGLRCLHLANLTYRIAGPASWADRLAQADLRALGGMPWIVGPTGSSHEDMLQALFRGSGLTPRQTVEANNYLLIRTLVANAVGISLVRSDIAEECERQGIFCLSRIPIPSTSLLFGFRKPRAAEQAIRTVESVVQGIWADGEDRNFKRPP